MKFRIATFTATALFALFTAIGANAQSSNTQNTVEYNKDGGYNAKTSSETKTPEGTNKLTEDEVKVKVDAEGFVKKTETVTQTTDPKGLGNKSENKSEVTEQEKANGGFSKTVKSKSTDSSGTTTIVDESENTVVDENGNVTATSSAKKTVDPKGLLNKKTVVDIKKKKKIVNGVVVEEEVQKK